MKPSTLVLLLPAFFLAVSAWPQTSTSADGPAPWTPPTGNHGRVSEVQKHMDTLSKKINLALKGGKISNAKAQSLRKEVTAVHHQMHDYYSQNKAFNLTANQEKQCFALLNKAAKDVDAAVSSSAGSVTTP